MGLVFYICVILVALLTFVMNFTSANISIELLLKLLGKLVPLFLLVISVIQIMAMYGFLDKSLF